MLNFIPVTIDSREPINAFLKQNPYRNCDFSFANIFCWKHKYNTTYCITNGFLFFRFHTSVRTAGYMMPLGAGDLKMALELLMEDARERKDIFYLFAVTSGMFEDIDKACPGMFEYKADRDWFEYLYLSQDLITLKGKKLQPKRNHINKFKKTYSYEYLPITRDIIPECLKLYNRWCGENGGCEEDESLAEERIATQMAFEYFERLEIRGGALRVNGEILAYSYGQLLGPDTFGVHAEKSLYEIDGGFSMINQQFAEHECSEFIYINREEDLGLESLRQAKLSYHPAVLMSKGYIRFK